MNILITGAGGFIGQALVAALLLDPSVTNLTLTDIVEPQIPIKHGNTTTKIHSIKADLTDKAACEKLFISQLTTVYLVHGLMSGAAEANLNLGLRVNIDSTRYILDVLRKVKPGIRVVFPSSLAAFGPSEGKLVTEATMPSPGSSYGAETLICEILLNDFSRRGLLDAPSGAASSFCSGIIREPLKGERSILPVSKDLKLSVCSTRTIIKNLVYAKDIPAAKFGPRSRVVNLPGITVTVDQMLQGLRDVGGEKTLALIEQKMDPAVEGIVAKWPAQFNTSLANALGFYVDGSLTRTVDGYFEDYANATV
ncbi:NAD(P)-binding protein [Cadophora sp. DSE1049]|nr:NAD(P)-binding protein [Cadophora sp. DSE1049]